MRSETGNPFLSDDCSQMIDFGPKQKKWVVGNIIKMSKLAGITDWLLHIRWRPGYLRDGRDTLFNRASLSRYRFRDHFQTDRWAHEAP